ncbi:hypothetical protein GXB81_13225 [Paraburkholderia sp. Ac-20336]|uniref:hypothetical protein n=1 Tax=Paraburkholderia sp. Ac-20336 TaxID=2703886 RepID=UPI001981F5AB|nr:hypothetical protein [Paraburkholderia sp. Ac-20336]MBN3804007.1 hypothetical protein [Paraburkholderia sp. Ac-20336]
MLTSTQAHSDSAQTVAAQTPRSALPIPLDAAIAERARREAEDSGSKESSNDDTIVSGGTRFIREKNRRSRPNRCRAASATKQRKCRHGKTGGNRAAISRKSVESAKGAWKRRLNKRSFKQLVCEMRTRGQ